MADMESRYKKPENYVNRELSWLDFDYRILEERSEERREGKGEDLDFRRIIKKK